MRMAGEYGPMGLGAFGMLMLSFMFCRLNVCTDYFCKIKNN